MNFNFTLLFATCALTYSKSPGGRLQRQIEWSRDCLLVAAADVVAGGCGRFLGYDPEVEFEK